MSSCKQSLQLHNIWQSHRNINVRSAHQSATCSLGTNFVFFRVLEVTKCVLVANQLSLVISPIYLCLKYHCNDLAFMIIIEELQLQYDNIVYKKVSQINYWKANPNSGVYVR